MEAFCCARAPKAIELQRKEMIQQVVTRSNAREHLAYFPGGVRFGDGTFGTSSLYWCGKFRHRGFPRDAAGCNEMRSEMKNALDEVREMES